MTIQLQGNAESTFANNVTISGGYNKMIADGRDQNEAPLLIQNTNNDGYTLVSQDAGGNTTSFLTTKGEATFTGKLSVSSDEGTDYAGRFTNNGTRAYGLLVDFPNSTDSTSTFIKAKVGADERLLIKANGSATFGGDIKVGVDYKNTYIAQGNQAQPGVTIQMSTADPVYNASSAAFVIRTWSQIAGGSANVTTRFNWDGSTRFSGTVAAPNTLLDLDTGGVLDVKERLQNTRAILFRLKAALIQPDADANTLRARLLEALDILTLEGDEE